MPSPAKVLAVLVAAGRSNRMQGSGDGSPRTVRKPLIELAGRPVFAHAALAFERCAEVTDVVIAAHPQDRSTIETWLASRSDYTKVRAVVPGGEERTDSVRVAVEAGFDRVGGELECVAVHDAARPCVSPESIQRAVQAARESGASLLALPVRDTLKRSSDGARAEGTVDRAELWAAQTPQVFAAHRFRHMLERAREANFRPTDDAALWEHFEGPVTIVLGESRNLKITYPEDLELARALLAPKTS